jgi:hypothetical protein
MENLPKHNPVYNRISEQARIELNRFQARPTDVFVCSPPKTGTTAMQLICHLLRGGADIAQYDDLYQVSPYLEIAHDLGEEINSATFQDHLPAPRCFKNHQLLSATHRGARYICLVRDPAAVAVSSFAFFLERQSPVALQCASVNEWVRQPVFVDTIYGGASLWQFYNEFVGCADDPAVLVVPYEMLLENDSKRCVLRAVALHMGVANADDALIDRVMAATTKEAMARSMSRFDLTWAGKRLLDVGRMDRAHAETFKPCRRVVVEAHQHRLDDAAVAFIDERWRTLTAPVIGFESYAELRAKLEERLRATAAAKKDY